ncbi:MAG TPA: radical SAM protein [Candidatus Paceibacterota bacterium]|nr:radical SAM protein [Saprospiraceae bacterium]HMP85136.1 radical SAM protein [Candidatus Paceibacterota bacterium]
MYASWEIISFCNLACNHCYSTYHDGHLSPKKMFKRLSIGDIKIGLKNLKSAGITQINLEGGEPTIMGLELVEAVKYSKDLGIETIVSTHGMFLFRNELIYKLIDAGIDSISLSLDGTTESVNDSIRVNHSGAAMNQFQIVLDFLEWYKVQCLSTIPFRLKINSVVRRDNIDNLRNIGRLVMNILPNGLPVQIKLAQVQPRGICKKVYNSISVRNLDFLNLVNHVKRYCTFQVVSRSYDGGEYPFVVVTKDGAVTIPNGEEHTEVIIDGCPLNIFDNSFVELFQKFIHDNPSFITKNAGINTYTSGDN